MKSNFFKLCFLLPVLAGTIVLSSCKKIFDVKPETVLTGEQTYRNVLDADAAVLGVYSKLMKLAKPYVLLNELRADLMSPTVNADLYLQQLSNHNVTGDNPYIDPTPYYDVILNCNDVMKHFDVSKRCAATACRTGSVWATAIWQHTSCAPICFAPASR